MVYVKVLPRMDRLRQLAKEVRNFPITGLGVAQYAEHQGYDKEMTNFIKLFSKGLVFNDRADFLEHCSLLERLLREERQSIPEHLRSPQD